VADIRVDEEGFDEGQASIVIETETATYFYHKEGAGFSSILDVDGRDWIGYRAGDGPAGEYRGIPNMVFRGEDKGYFHPGHSGAKASTTDIVESGAKKLVLRSTSGNGKWRVEWEIDQVCARMTVLEVDADDPSYWFLYEGTPGGHFRPADSGWGRSSGETGTLDDSWEASLPSQGWVYFTDPERRRSLFLHCRKQAEFVDMYKPMPPMTVFGFGRQQEGVGSYITNEQTVLTIGLVDTADWGEVKAAIADRT
jgi:hypothetical protein